MFKYLVVVWNMRDSGPEGWDTAWWGTNKREAFKQFRAYAARYPLVGLVKVEALAVADAYQDIL